MHGKYLKVVYYSISYCCGATYGLVEPVWTYIGLVTVFVGEVMSFVILSHSHMLEKADKETYNS